MKYAGVFSLYSNEREKYISNCRLCIEKFIKGLKLGKVGMEEKEFDE